MSIMGHYEYTIEKTHPRANKEGQVYVHVLEAEKKLGRLLFPEEVVHHIDENKLNNHPDNLMVFATKSDHTSFHQHGLDKNIIRLTENGSYICTFRCNICPECGKRKDIHSKICRECFDKIPKSNRKPTKEQLLQTIVNSKGNFTGVGKLFGVSDNAIRKWCKSYNLPSHSYDYKFS